MLVKHLRIDIAPIIAARPIALIRYAIRRDKGQLRDLERRATCLQGRMIEQSATTNDGRNDNASNDTLQCLPPFA